LLLLLFLFIIIIIIIIIVISVYYSVGLYACVKSFVHRFICSFVCLSMHSLVPACIHPAHVRIPMQTVMYGRSCRRAGCAG